MTMELPTARTAHDIWFIAETPNGIEIQRAEPMAEFFMGGPYYSFEAAYRAKRKIMWRRVRKWITGTGIYIGAFLILIASAVSSEAAEFDSIEIGYGYGYDTSPDLVAMELAFVWRDRIRVGLHRYGGNGYNNTNAASLSWRKVWREDWRIKPMLEVGVMRFNRPITYTETSLAYRQVDPIQCLFVKCVGLGGGRRFEEIVEREEVELISSTTAFTLFAGVRVYELLTVGACHQSTGGLSEINEGINQACLRLHRHF